MRRHLNLLLAISADAVGGFACLAAAFVIRLGQHPVLSPWDAAYWPLYGLAAPLTVTAMWYFGGYHLVVRYMSRQGLVPIAKSAIAAGGVLLAAAFVLRIHTFPRTVSALFALLAFAWLAGTRYMVHLWFLRRFGELADGPKVLIYGAGLHGIQVARLLRTSGAYTPVGFLDEDTRLHGRLIHGARVYAPAQCAEVMDATGAELVVVAVTEHTSRARILAELADAGFRVLVASRFDPSTHATPEEILHRVALEELIDRQPIGMDEAAVRAALAGDCVLVSGAGGSIGAEICRQLMACRCRCLVLLEHSEPALFSIARELERGAPSTAPATRLIRVLGSAGDGALLEQIMRRHGVGAVFHAAAYKHVGVLEENPRGALLNNVLATRTIARVAAACGVNRFVLVSTDKAVNPKSVLGASKRLAELAVREASATASDTRFCIVRFGNVLGSSGSVLPLFAEQMSRGEPIEVTDPGATRFVITIPEAAQLVLQAAAMTRGGETYVLDMGTPVRIDELAARFARLAGIPRSTVEPGGVRYIGLRPGEKLHEELIEDGELLATAHPHVHEVREAAVDPDRVVAALDAAERLIGDPPERIRTALHDLVAELRRPPGRAVLGGSR